MEISSTKREVVEELHKPARKNFHRRITVIKGYGDLWQIDLAEMQPYASVNKGHRYIFIVIDCYSKFIWARGVKSKTAIELFKAMKSVLKEVDYAPKHIQSDHGGEFYNQRFAKLMEQYNINHYSTYSTKKASIVERVIRTLKSWLYKEFSARGSYKWINILPDIIKKYNYKVHRTTGMRPADVTPRTRIHAYKHSNIVSKPKFHVGDIVRINKYKNIFEKGYTANWTTELFKITKVRKIKPTTYLISDMSGQPVKGCFYEQELQKTRNPDIYLVEKILRRKKYADGRRKIYVKWLGLPNKENSWILENDII